MNKLFSLNSLLYIVMLALVTTSSLNIYKIKKRLKDIECESKAVASSNEVKVNSFSNPSTSYLFIGDNTGIANLNHDLKILFNTQDITIGYNLMIGNGWENSLSDLMLTFVKPGDKVVDLGANYGTHTLRLAKKINSDGKLQEKLFAFEANPKVFGLLKRSVELNGLNNIVKIFNQLITDQDNQEYLFTYSDEFNTGGAKITPTTNSSYVHNLDKFVKLSSSKLDDAIPAGTKINFMKLDIEGAEFLALNGATRVLEESKDEIVILLEWNYPLLKDAVENLNTLTQKYDFKVWMIRDGVPQALTELDKLENFIGDIIISKKEITS